MSEPIKSVAVVGDELPGMVNMSDVGQFIILSARRESLNNELKRIEGDRNKVAARLAEQFIMNGVQSVNADGYTLYKSVDSYVSVKSELQQQAVQYMLDNDLMELVAVQPSRFKSWANELIAEGTMPPQVESMTNRHEKVNIRIRRSG